MVNAKKYAEGGRGWMVVLACFIAEFIVYGTMKAFGVLITPIQLAFGTDLWIIGSIAILYYGVVFLLNPITAIIARRYGGRRVVIFGGIIYGLGLVLASMSDSVALFATSLIVIAGIGASCALKPSRGEIAFHFQRRFNLAIFLTLIGSPIGVMLYGPMTQVLIDTYGWRGALLILGGISFSLIWAGMLIQRPKGIYASIPDGDSSTDDDVHDEQSEKHLPSHQRKAKYGQLFISCLCLDIFNNFEFNLIAGIKLFTNVAYCGFIVYMVPNALALGLTPKESSFLTTAFGVGSLAGLFLGALAIHTLVLPINVGIILVSIVTSLVLVVTPMIPSFIGQMAITFMIGIGIFYVTEVTAVQVNNLPFADDYFGVAMGWMGLLSGVASSVGDVISGWVYDRTESFLGTFLVFTGSMFCVILCCIVGLIRSHFIQRKDAKITQYEPID